MHNDSFAQDAEAFAAELRARGYDATAAPDHKHGLQQSKQPAIILDIEFEVGSYRILVKRRGADVWSRIEKVSTGRAPTEFEKVPATVYRMASNAVMAAETMLLRLSGLSQDD